MHKLLFVVLVQVILLPVCAQRVVLHGKVYDKSNSKKVDFANVYIKSINCVASSGADGQYRFDNLAQGEYVLQVSHLGYEKYSQKITLSKEISTIDIALTPKAETISPIVVTGTGTSYHLDNVPVQTEIITQKDITEVGGQSVEEVLAGVSSSLDFTLSSMGTNLKINGLGNDYVLILVNGKRLTGGLSGYTDLSRLNANDIKQIEIVKGASSTLYGSDAIAGVINIITKKTLNKLDVTNNSSIQNYGRIKQLNTLSFNGGKLAGKTSFNYRHTDGWQLSNMKFNNAWQNNHDLPFLEETYYKPVNKSNAYTIAQDFDYRINQNLKVYAGGSWYEKTLFFPFKAQMHNYYYNNRGVSVGGDYNINPNSKLNFSVDYNNYLYYTEYPYKYNESYMVDGSVLRLTYYPGDRFKNSDETTVIAQAKGVFKLNDVHNLSVGTEFLYEMLESQYRLTVADATASTYSLYVQDEITLVDDFSVVAGIRAIYYNKTGMEYTPKLSAMYNLNPFTLRVTYANGFKSPTLRELYYFYESDRMGMHRLYMGNEDLKPQKSHYFSLATDYKNKSFTAGVSVYLNKVNDMIDYLIISADDYTRLTGDTLSYNRKKEIEEFKWRYNIDEARTVGVDCHVGMKLFKQLKVNLGYSYVDAKNLTQNIRLNGISAHSATAKASWTKKWKDYKLNANVSGVYKSDKFYLEEDETRSYAKPYQLWKITTNHTFYHLNDCDITAVLGIDNLLNFIDDSPYGSHYATLSPGRTYLVGLNIKYHKYHEQL
nr:TonB-dependent receptor [uncultured Carboxylicivirga sp.]